VGLHRLLGQEEALPDLAVYKPVCDELEHLDLPRRRILADLARRGRCEGNDRSAAARAASCGSRLEAAAVISVAVEDLLALSGIHASGIGGLRTPL